MEYAPSNSKSFSHIFLADSDWQDQEIFCSQMEQLHPDVQVDVFNDGQALLAFLKASPSTLAACIVLAYKLPDLSAAEVLQAIGFLSNYREVPKIIWSDLVMEIQVSECLSLGASQFVLKRNTFKDMNEFVESVYLLIHSSDTDASDSPETKTAG